MGPFPTGRSQKKFLLVVVDYFTKWVEVELLATISAAPGAKICMENCVSFWIAENNRNG